MPRKFPPELKSSALEAEYHFHIWVWEPEG